MKIMKVTIERKLHTLIERYQEVSLLLNDPTVISDQNRLKICQKNTLI